MVDQTTSNRKSNVDLGLFILRTGLGIMYMLHGFPKLFGGPDYWAQIGNASSAIGIDFAHIFLGFMAAFAEFFGGLFLILGIVFTPSLLLLIATMIVAVASHIAQGDSFTIYSHAMTNALVCIGLLFTGPGPYRLKLNRFFNISDTDSI